jgi:biopolymer transport protein ExbD
MAGNIGDGEFGFQIAPMLDILFVLLLFFMVSAGAQKHEATLSTQLPGLGGPGGEIPAQIEIDSDGQVSLSQVPVDAPTDSKLPTLVDRLKSIVHADPKQPVIITPSRTTKQQRVIDVLNACAAANVKDLGFGPPSD